MSCSLPAHPAAPGLLSQKTRLSSKPVIAARPGRCCLRLCASGTNKQPLPGPRQASLHSSTDHSSRLPSPLDLEAARGSASGSDHARALVLGISTAAMGLAALLAWQVRPASAAASEPNRATTHVHTAGRRRVAVSSSSSRPVAGSGPTIYSSQNQSMVYYRTMELFALPTYGKVLAVIAVAMPVLLLGSALYKRAIGCSWGEALTTSYSVLNNCPGVDVVNENNPKAWVVLNIIYVMGLLSFAAVLGILTDDIGNAVDRVRNGQHPVVEQHHTLVLGWNQQTLPLLRQMAMAHGQDHSMVLPTPVVVLADKDKADMDEEIGEALEDKGLEVISRSGVPTRMEDLARVSAHAADTVVVMWPQDRDVPAAAASQAATLSALKAVGGVTGQKLVVQSTGSAVADYNAAEVALDMARTGQLAAVAAERVVTSGTERICQLTAQVAVQPGLEDVLTDLLEYEADVTGAEFYIKAIPQLDGQRYSVVRRHFDKGIVVGYITPEGKQCLNPKEREVVPPGSQLVFVAHNMSQLEPLEEPLTPAKLRARGGNRTSLLRKNLVLLNFTGDATAIMQSLGEFSPRGSRVTLVSESVSPDAVSALKKRGVKVTVVEANPASARALERAGVARADSVVLCGLHRLEPKQADAQVVASVLQLHAAADKHGPRKRPLDVTATITNPSTEDVLWHMLLSYQAELQAAAQHQGLAREGTTKGSQAAAGAGCPVQLHLLCPDDLMSGMLTQAAITPQLSQVFAEMFTVADGCELYLHDAAAAYGFKTHTPHQWGALAEVVRGKGKTAIGIVPADPEGALRLAVGAEEEVVLQPGDRLVVLAQDF